MTKFSKNQKVKVIKDIPSVDGMLHNGSIVRIDEITSGGSVVRGAIRVTDSLGKIWWVNKEDIVDV